MKKKLFLETTQMENPSFTGDGYTSLGLLYITFALFMWVVPSIISVLGPKVTLAIGSLGYSLLITSFYMESEWALYTASVLSGMGSSMIWTSQGNYMILISSSLTITRNMAIFSILMNSSLFFGNIFTFLKFEGKLHLHKETRTAVVCTLFAISLTGTIFMVFLPPPRNKSGKKIKEDHGGPITALKKTWQIASTKYMLILFIPCAFMGLQKSFTSGVYGACVGFTKQLKNSQQLVPLIGLTIGIGQVIVEIFLVLLGKQIAKWKWGYTVIMIATLVLEYCCFILMFINFPNNSAFGVTYDSAIIESRQWVAILAAFLIGVSDGIYVAMIPSIIGMIFPNESVYGCAMFNFVFSFFSSVGFFSNNYIGLYWQLLVLTVIGTLGSACYSYVSMDRYKIAKAQEEQTKTVK